MRKFLVFLLLAVLPLFASGQQPPKPGKVVFVCQHGAALSVIAASYFNKMAAEQHLNVHAIARGVTPQENLSVSATQGLKADGMTWELEKPLPLTPGDAVGALRIVILYPIPKAYEDLAPVEDWSRDVPPMSQAYAIVREAILKHLRTLLPQVAHERVASWSGVCSAVPVSVAVPPLWGSFSGEMQVDLLIDSTGSVRPFAEIHVSNDEDINRQITDTISQWRFIPGQIDAKAVQVRLPAIIEYRKGSASIQFPWLPAHPHCDKSGHVTF